jgi:hypothetical protein
MTLDQITGAVCRAYATARAGQGRSNKGKGGGARRDLQDLAAAINHHSREGLHRGLVRVVLPERGKARQRWLTRDEFAKLLCYRAREEDRETGKRPMRHLCRFLLLGVYTGRARAPCSTHHGNAAPAYLGSIPIAAYSIVMRKVRGRLTSASRQFVLPPASSRT